MNSHDVAVIGAGLAGTTAARRLADAGLDVVVLEARDRVGGRTCTVREGFANGQHCDFGGELVTTHYPAMVQLCADLGVTLSDPFWIARPEVRPEESRLEGYLAEDRIMIDGELLKGARFEAVATELRKILESVPPAETETIDQWTRRSGMSYDAREAVFAIGRLPQHEPHQLEPTFLLETQIGPARRVIGGSQVLAETLVKGVEVRLDAPVLTVRQSAEVVEIGLERGEVIWCRRAIVTAPGWAVRSIGFEPPLSSVRTSALTSLPSTPGGKVIGQYAEGDAVRAALSRAIFTNGEINVAWVSNNYVTEGPAVVSALVCGDASRILESDELAGAAIDALIGTAVGGPVTRITTLRKHWGTDPFARGVVSMPFYGTRAALTEVMAAPDGRVHFAGDYTECDLTGTMEGAIRSGQRAADEVLADH